MFPVEIDIPGVPCSTNRALRMHWRERVAEIANWKQSIYYSLSLNSRNEISEFTQKGGKLHVKVSEFRHGELDPDNLHGSVKFVLDAIVHCRLARSDAEKHMKYAVEQIQIEKTKQPHTKIRFDKQEIQ